HHRRPDSVASSSQPLFGQGRRDSTSTAVGSVGVDGHGVGWTDGHLRGYGDHDRDSVGVEDAARSSTLPADDTEDESGVESTAAGGAGAGRPHHPKKAVKARGRGRGAVKSRRG
ncbi:unnamed protein product, partial [Ectocarpus fasciculatus]